MILQVRSKVDMVKPYQRADEIRNRVEEVLYLHQNKLDRWLIRSSPKYGIRPLPKSKKEFQNVSFGKWIRSQNF